jgi:membrane protein DedA with SNARE-associated domain
MNYPGSAVVAGFVTFLVVFLIGFRAAFQRQDSEAVGMVLVVALMAAVLAGSWAWLKDKE